MVKKNMMSLLVNPLLHTIDVPKKTGIILWFSPNFYGDDWPRLTPKIRSAIRSASGLIGREDPGYMNSNTFYKLQLDCETYGQDTFVGCDDLIWFRIFPMDQSQSEESTKEIWFIFLGTLPSGSLW